MHFYLEVCPDNTLQMTQVVENRTPDIKTWQGRNRTDMGYSCNVFIEFFKYVINLANKGGWFVTKIKWKQEVYQLIPQD